LALGIGNNATAAFEVVVVSLRCVSKSLLEILRGVYVVESDVPGFVDKSIPGSWERLGA